MPLSERDHIDDRPLIKLKKAPRQVAQRILGELEVRDLIKHAKGGRDRLMLQVAYYGGLRVSELVSLTWSQVIRRDSGEAQLSVVERARVQLVRRDLPRNAASTDHHVLRPRRIDGALDPT